MHGYDEASLYLYGLGDHGHLHVLTHSFPTLRSSELVFLIQSLLQALDHAIRLARLDQAVPLEPLAVDLARRRMLGDLAVHQRLREGRLVGSSEEPTSELQSLMRISYAVFCLKKNNKQLRHTLPHSQAFHHTKY